MELELLRAALRLQIVAWRRDADSKEAHVSRWETEEKHDPEFVDSNPEFNTRWKGVAEGLQNAAADLEGIVQLLGANR